MADLTAEHLNVVVCVFPALVDGQDMIYVHQAGQEVSSAASAASKDPFTEIGPQTLTQPLSGSATGYDLPADDGAVLAYRRGHETPLVAALRIALRFPAYETGVRLLHYAAV
jgi:hypothetical protein